MKSSKEIINIGKQTIAVELDAITKLKDKNFVEEGFLQPPKGESNKHILYHVKHSVLKSRISKEFLHNHFHLY